MIGDAKLGGEIEHPAKAHRRVDRDAAKGLTGQPQLTLQHIIGEDHRRVQVLHEIVKGLAHRRNDGPAVGACCRQDDGLVDLLVDAEDRAIGVLDRVIEALAASDCRPGSGAAGSNQSKSEQARDEKR